MSQLAPYGKIHTYLTEKIYETVNTNGVNQKYSTQLQGLLCFAIN